MTKMNAKLFTLLFASVFILLFSQAAFAHKVNMFAYAEGDSIFMEGYFADGKKAKNCEITVYNKEGKVVHTGLTSEEGQYEFPIPEMTDLKIELDAGMGHKTEFLLPKNELSESEEDSLLETEDLPIAASTSSYSGTGINKQELSLIVDKAVAKAMRPVMRNIAEMREEKSLSSIVGGIGFIFGLLGLYFYFKAKKDFESTLK